MPSDVEHVRLRKLLQGLVVALRDGNELGAAVSVEDAAAASHEQQLAFLISNELWGGAGSIADQAGVGAPRSEATRAIERALTELGMEQMRLGIVNPRTAMWVEAFSSWAKNGV